MTRNEDPVFQDAEWHRKIAEARRRGDHLLAYDVAVQAQSARPDELGFAYQAVLALARSGALNGARRHYDELVASGRQKNIADLVLAQDFAALDGRLWKDLAARSSPEAASQFRLRSAEAYSSAFERFGGFYPAINASTMYLACGHVDKAREFALAARVAASESIVDYWSCVTQGEASLILGDTGAAAKSLEDAAAFGAENLDEVAATRRQLKSVARLMNAPAQILDRLPKPRVLTWISSPRFPVESIAAIAASGQRVIAFGPVLSLADVAVAQALLRAGAAVHLVLPCDKDVLLLSAPFAETTGSAEDLRSLLAQASGVTPVTGEGGPEEPAARLLCQQQACGLANLRAESLAVTSEILLGQDGVAFGDAQPIPRDFAANPAGLDLSTHAIRTPCAILFGDVRGFSRLREPEQLDFLTHIIGGFADVLDSSAHKQYAETAGDGLYVVFSDIMAAVECCFRLRDVLRPERVTAAGLPSHLGIRLSAHIGPLFRRFDRVIGREKFCGMEVIRTARIEPVTPVGEIFVTEQFAASLAYAATGVFICEYVGLQPMAKGFGTCRMYSLRRAIQ